MVKTMGCMVITLGIVFLLSLSATHLCFAGGINGHESAVISAASGTFEYDGVTYKAKPGYISQLQAKLSADDVDLDAAQSQEAIATIYANVGTGVASGYLYPVGGKTKEKDNASKGNDGTSNKKNNAGTEVSVTYNQEAGEYTAKNAFDGTVLMKFHNVIKDTGYSYTSVFYLGAVLLIAATVSMVFMIRQHFAHNNHVS